LNDNCNFSQDDEELRLLLASVVDYAIIKLGADGTILSWNKGAERIKGYKADEIVGKNFSRFYTEADNDTGKPSFELQQAIAQGRFEDLGWRVRKDGSLFWANVIITALRDDAGKLRGFAKVTRDITEKHKSEEALRLSEEKQRLLISSVVDYAIIMLDNDGTVLSWNEGAERIKGYGAEEIIGKNFGCFYTEEDVCAGIPDEALKTARKHGTFESLGWRLRQDGSRFFANVIITALTDSSGAPRGFAKVTRDITEQRKWQEELQQARDSAVAGSQYKSEFLSHMSHEIRTPLNGIIGMTEILMRSDLTQSQYKFASAIKDSSNALMTVINDILDFSKIEAGKLLLETLDLEPVSLVESVAELLAAQAREKDLPLLTFVDPQLPVAIRSDPLRLRQILINFVANAVKFSEKGDILIRASLEKVDKKNGDNHDNIKFAVTDHGTGMSDAQIENLFQPFVQGDGSMTRKYGGTGLGLSICKKLVTLLNGKIGVHSVKGFGSTFWFTVPLVASSARQTKKAVSPCLTGARILIVDDQKNAREILQSYLTHWGMRASAVESAEEAIISLSAEASRDPFDLVLVDMCMPDIDGMQLGKEIRESEILKNGKLVLLTAYDKPGIGQEAIALGFDAYLTKPLRQSDLLDVITSVLLNAEPEDKEAKDRFREGADNSRHSIDKSRETTRKELILVAEDHPVNQEVALILLRELGFEAHIAATGKEALERLRRVPYAAILMDCQMPVLSGLDATIAIRKGELRTGKHLPIIAMTAHAVEGSREQCLAAGMDDYMSKPISLQQLKLVVEKWIPTESTAPEIPTQQITSNWLEALHKIYGEEDTARILDLFLEETEKILQQIRWSIDTFSRGKLLIAAHGLKGICQTIFAKEMGQICAELENSGQDEDWVEADHIHTRLVEELEEMRRIFAHKR